MKRTLAIVLALVMVLALVACTGTTPEQPTTTGNDLAGTYDITVWVGENAVDLTKKQIEDFNNSNEFGIKFNATVNPVSEATSADQMLVDISAGADIYCFAQDQFARLVQGGALNRLGDKAAETVRAANDPGVVAAATSGDTLYAYPLTSDNGYFMYYDKTVIPEEDVDSLEKLIADCEAANKWFAFEANTSAWYIASWFFATGCVSEWTTGDDGSFISVKDTFNSPEGLIAAKGMKKLVDSPMHKSSSAAAEFASDAAIVVTGTWAYSDIQGLLGDKMGVTDLPSFEVDGKEYHLGSFNGCKLMGIKPQDDATRAAALHKLAQYLTDEARQMERFEALAWGPSNTNAQNSEAVQNNPGLAALLKQNAYSRPQGQIHGSWWDIAKVIADDVKAAEDEEGLKQALQNYYDKISALFNMTEEEKNAWAVIGAVCGTNWDTDLPMTEAPTDKPKKTATPTPKASVTSTPKITATPTPIPTWSDWSTNQPPSDALTVETKTQYRYRDKSTTIAETSSLSGWTLESGPETVYGDWSSWSDTSISSSSALQVEKRTVYRLYYYACSKCGYHMPWYDEGSGGHPCYNCGKHSTPKSSHKTLWQTTPYNKLGSSSSPGNKRKVTIDGCLWYFNPDDLNGTPSSSKYIKDQWRSRSVSYVYTFYKWSDWSSWSDSAVSSSSTRQVETRTLYRYKK